MVTATMYMKPIRKERVEKTPEELQEELVCKWTCRVLILLSALGILAIVGVCLYGVGYVATFLFIPTMIPKYFPRTTTPPGVYSEWGTFYNVSCDRLRVTLFHMDCKPMANRCLDEIKIFGKDGVHSEEKFWSIMKNCFIAERCMDDMKCNEIREHSHKFVRKVHSFFMTNMEFPKCFANFVRAVREDSFDNCTKEYDFLSRSYKIKNRAYIDGMQCVLDFAEENCEETVVSYLENAYDWFVELGTIPTDECGVYEQLEAVECRQWLEWFHEASNKIGKGGNNSQEDYEEVVSACDKLHECTDTMYDDCAIKKMIPFTKSHCSRMRWEVTPFMECFRRIKFGNFISNTSCSLSNGNNFDFNDPFKACQQISTPRAKCLKEVMTDYCGSEATRDGFDEGRAHLWETWDCENSYRRVMKRKINMFKIW